MLCFRRETRVLTWLNHRHIEVAADNVAALIPAEGPKEERASPSTSCGNDDCGQRFSVSREYCRHLNFAV